jgi:hypothetical protein
MGRIEKEYILYQEWTVQYCVTNTEKLYPQYLEYQVPRNYTLYLSTQEGLYLKNIYDINI